MNKTRKNVLPDGVEAVHGMVCVLKPCWTNMVAACSPMVAKVLGLYAFAYNIGYSVYLRKWPDLPLAVERRTVEPMMSRRCIQEESQLGVAPSTSLEDAGLLGY